MPATITRRLVSIGDAAEALAVSTRTVRRYIADWQLRLGRKTLRIKADLIEPSSTQAGRQLAVRRSRARIRGCGADTSQLGRQPGR